MSPTSSKSDRNDWRLWCRLCAKDDPQGNICAYFKDKEVCGLGSTANVSLLAAIEKYFWVEIKRDDEQLPKMLCTKCFSLVNSLVNFSERVAKVQQMFRVLHNTTQPHDLHEIRLKYGLLDEEREHVLMQQQLPEVHNFDSKSKINHLEKRIFENETLMTTINPLQQLPQMEIKKEIILDEPKNEELGLINHEFVNVDNDNKYIKVAEDEEDTKPLKLSTKTVFLEKPCQREQADVESLLELQKKRCRFHRRQPSTDDEKDVDEENEAHKKHTEALAKPCEPVYSYPCSDCPRKFKRFKFMQHHMKRVHAKDTMPTAKTCTECSKVFTTSQQLQRHAKIHLPSEQRRVVPCTYCEKKFSSHSNMQSHAKIHLPLEQRLVSCTYCEKKFSSYANMQTHIKHIHMNERPFICEECGIAVRTNVLLREHMLTHTDYAPFECEVCHKCFKHQTALKKHKETHDSNKHTCTKCGLQLNSRVTLNRHLLVHSDEMTHKCDYCGRAFKRAKTLKTHLLLHTGLKPYSCDFCDRTFANGSNCRTHKKKSHPEELAALEAAGGKTYTNNIPMLKALKAVIKVADNLEPVTCKQSGCFAINKKP